MNNPGTVEAPQAHAVDYTIWNRIQASCDVTRTIVTGQTCFHNGFTYLCRSVVAVEISLHIYKIVPMRGKNWNQMQTAADLGVYYVYFRSMGESF